MIPIINIGPLAIQAAGFVLLLSFFIGSWLTRRFAQNLGTNVDVIENSILVGLIAGITGARIGFLLKNPAVFINSPLSLLSLTPSMLDTSFGILVGILTAFILAQKKNLPLWPTLDSLTPFFVLIFVGVHLSNYANGDAYGNPTMLPWGVPLWNDLRHPVQLYALILAVILCTWLFFHTRRLTLTGYMHSGVLFNLVLGSLAVITLFTQAFVAEKLLLGNLDMNQLFAFIILLGSLGLIFTRAFLKPKPVGVLISMGSNHNPRERIIQANHTLASEFRIRRASSLYLTEDVKGQADYSAFINQVIEMETKLSYLDLVARLKAIEVGMGREPGNKKVVPLDIDVLTYANEVFDKDGKRIPDPNFIKYRYIAVPLAEISPTFRHPANGRNIQEILEKIDYNTSIIKIDEVENGIKA